MGVLPVRGLGSITPPVSCVVRSHYTGSPRTSTIGRLVVTCPLLSPWPPLHVYSPEGLTSDPRPDFPVVSLVFILKRLSVRTEMVSTHENSSGDWRSDLKGVPSCSHSGRNTTSNKLLRHTLVNDVQWDYRVPLSPVLPRRRYILSPSVPVRPRPSRLQVTLQ